MARETRVTMTKSGISNQAKQCRRDKQYDY